MDPENKNQEPFKDPMVEAFGEMHRRLSITDAAKAVQLCLANGIERALFPARRQ